jgi:hypothetical protein
MFPEFHELLSRQLRAAIRALGLAVLPLWRSFEVDSTVPQTPVDRNSSIKKVN